MTTATADALVSPVLSVVMPCYNEATTVEPAIKGVLALPFVALSARTSTRHFAAPRHFLPAMRFMVIAYMVATGAFTAGVLLQAWR